MANQTIDANGNFNPLPPATPLGAPRGIANYKEGPYDPTDPVLGWKPSVEPAQFLNTVTRFRWTWFTDSVDTVPGWHKEAAALADD